MSLKWRKFLRSAQDLPRHLACAHPEMNLWIMGTNVSFQLKLSRPQGGASRQGRCPFLYSFPPPRPESGGSACVSATRGGKQAGQK